MKIPFLIWSLNLGILLNCVPHQVTKAQVTSDNTVNTQVTQNGNVSEITGGQTEGSNLFHSFQDFSVPTGNEAAFNNANDISNIFSRVTGGNISNIDGAIRANDANLFLINPAGIMFGAGARLDLGGGSFYGSTADSILFPDGVEFSASDTQIQPILTINAPIGLGFRDNPKDVEVTGATLEVDSGQDLTFVGGNISLDGASLIAPGGRVELGGLSVAGEVGLSDDGSFTFAENIDRADISLINGAFVKVRDAGGGFINVNARNFSLSEESMLLGGIESGTGSPETRAGDITINAGSILLEDNSQISTATEGIGDSGNIFITATNVEFTDEIQGDDTASKLVASTFGQGNAGDIEINASEIVLDGSAGGVFTSVGIKANDDPVPGVVGDGGNITVNTDSISFFNGARLSTILGGVGIGGSIAINANDFVRIDGRGDEVPRFSEFFGGEVKRASGIFNLVRGGLLEGEEDGVGNAGIVEINTQDLFLTNESNITTNTTGQGDAGDIKINATGTIELDNVAQILAQVIFKIGQGNAGDIIIQANEEIILDDSSAITSDIRDGGLGTGGNIFLTTPLLSLKNSSRLSTSTFEEGVGEAGKLFRT